RQTCKQRTGIAAERRLRQGDERERGRARQDALVPDAIRQRVPGVSPTRTQSERCPRSELRGRRAAGLRESAVSLLLRLNVRGGAGRERGGCEDRSYTHTTS